MTNLAKTIWQINAGNFLNIVISSFGEEFKNIELKYFGPFCVAIRKAGMMQICFIVFDIYDLSITNIQNKNYLFIFLSQKFCFYVR